MASAARVLVIGLDSVPPDLLFDRFLPEMPRLRALREDSRWGSLRSCDPPITVPAWAVMFSGVDPGTLGLYGFRHRKAGTYWDQYLPSPASVQAPLIWDILSRAGRRVCVMGMPPGYPPPRVNGVYVSDFLTPPGATGFVTPSSLAREIKNVNGGYEFDITFRAEDRAQVRDDLFRMTRQHFAVARHLWQKEPWDFFAFHEIGPDRLHHAFWKYFDPSHRDFRAGNAFETVARDYYRLLDQEIGAWLDLVPEDVVIYVVSDHGSQGMEGCFCINEWLIRQGYLTLREKPPKPGTALEDLQIDWPRTRVWGAGGYYARLQFNIQGREPQGVVSVDDVPSLVSELRARLSGVRRPDGLPLRSAAYTPSDLYRAVRGDPPDLIVYLGDLKWRSAGTVGHPGLFLTENDLGPDDSVHSFDGIMLVRDPSGHDGGARLSDQRIEDIAPTLLVRMGLSVPAHVQAHPIPDLV
jgi:predicted AlkP superfamily phosphohydrolase/phosphomutase